MKWSPQKWFWWAIVRRWGWISLCFFSSVFFFSLSDKVQETVQCKYLISFTIKLFRSAYQTTEMSAFNFWGSNYLRSSWGSRKYEQACVALVCNWGFQPLQTAFGYLIEHTVVDRIYQCTVNCVGFKRLLIGCTAFASQPIKSQRKKLFGG